jgi:selenocysteine lyase/cysteine desulfurase
MGLQKLGVETRLVPHQDAWGTLTVEELDKQVNGRTRLVAVSAIQFFTGGRADLAALGAYCHERGIIFVVDAIQAIGHIPIDVRAMKIDVLATGAQKSMMALPGTGFLYVRRNLAEQWQPLSIGPTATQNWIHWTAYDTTPEPGAWRFKGGTISLEGLVSAITSLEMLNELGLSTIDQYTNGLIQALMADIITAGHRVLTPTEPSRHGPILTFQVSDDPAITKAVYEHLIARDVMLAQHLNKKGIAFLRVAVHCYNNEDDRQRFIQLLNSAVKEFVP